MKYYFAPLEGITDLTYRRIHHKYFGGIDRYFMPFLSPTQNHCLTRKEERELPLAKSIPCETVPQILTKSPEDFLWAAQCCYDRGYKEMNLNMGCPSGTVVTKGKGAGMLSNLQTLRSFLDAVFAASPLPISLKTRVGMDSSDEFPAILELCNQYPAVELIVHPRVRKAFYKGPVEGSAFRYALEHSKHPLCYNGDVQTKADIEFLHQEFPSLNAIMIGRGLIVNPGFLSGHIDRTLLYQFHEELFDTYCEVFGNKHNAMCRMKEIWSLLIGLFVDAEQHNKKLKRCSDYLTFRKIAVEILTQLSMIEPKSNLREAFL
ncbi:MAG: tRNA-dihydrouridine synthase family protein [Oscillospiraceae bacterium]|nr:tRNA-dihydrouridine synthase family protein [Oscillospiraceae bacterium]